VPFFSFVVEILLLCALSFVILLVTRYVTDWYQSEVYINRDL